MGDGDYSACLGDFDLCACESGVCPVLVQGLLERGEDVGFPLLSWESRQGADVPGGSVKLRPPLGPIGAQHQLGVTADTPVAPAALAEPAGTGALLFTELMK